MKKILLALVGLIVLVIAVLGVLIAVMPTDFAVEREVVINKPKAEVFEFMKYVKNQEKWSSWAKKDPNSKHTYTGTDGEVGFISAWDSEHPEVGKGEQEIKKIIDGERIDVELRFKHPMEVTSSGYTKLEAVGADKTKVKWGFTGSLPRPFNLIGLVSDMDAEVGKDFDTGLANLKEILEKMPPKEEPVDEEKDDDAKKEGDA